METVKDGFRQMGFPNTIGAIDGCYVEMPKPKEDGISYICRKNFACVTLQVSLFFIFYIQILFCFVPSKCPNNPLRCDNSICICIYEIGFNFLGSV